MPTHFMLIPSLACPAECRYCFGPHQPAPPMNEQTLGQAIDFMAQASQSPDNTNNAKVEITFHGGEPLTAGYAFFRQALATACTACHPLNPHSHPHPYPLPCSHPHTSPHSPSSLHSPFSPHLHQLKFSLQSNLWLLTEEFCDLFLEYGVSIGTSLDGPGEITDAQRGVGYFRRTMDKIALARRKGLTVGCIATFTRASASRAEEVFDFFVREGLNFTIHAAVRPLGRPIEDYNWLLSPEAYGDLLVRMLEYYLPRLETVQISALDQLCRSVSAQAGGVCTFQDCLGHYLAVAPDGGIYPCQRFAGQQEFCLGKVKDSLKFDDLKNTPVWQKLQERERRMHEVCADCAYYSFCKGGCPYNWLASTQLASNWLASGGEDKRDPYCPAYKRIFGHIIDRGLEEVFSADNMQAVVETPEAGNGLLRRGRLLSLIKGDVHPREIVRRARRIAAAVALADGNMPITEVAAKLAGLGLASTQQIAESSLLNLQQHLKQGVKGLNNLYLHVTFACNLQCAHCYAQSGPERISERSMSPHNVSNLCQEAARLGFRHAVITGGEPLVHPEGQEILEALKSIRPALSPLQLVLRTNLAVPLKDQIIGLLGDSVDQIVVSLDGDRDYHDNRRGAGSYDRTVGNLRKIIQAGCRAEISLATVVPATIANGKEGDAVRALAVELGISRLRFRPLLPLGRAAETGISLTRETLWAHMAPHDVIAYGFSPLASCGLGQNLYVEPSGNAYPCYACHGGTLFLGNVCETGLEQVVCSTVFRQLSGYTVDTNRLCKRCVLRYLCGGACRAWGGELGNDMDAAPVNCQPLFERAKSLLMGALDKLKIPVDRWIAEGLPFPDNVNPSEGREMKLTHHQRFPSRIR